MRWRLPDAADGALAATTKTAEAMQLAHDLALLLGYVEQLRTVETAGLEPMQHPWSPAGESPGLASHHRLILQARRSPPGRSAPKPATRWPCT